MSLKAELETWAAALKAYDDDDLESAINLFLQIADSSKILTNIGLIYATLGEHESAVENFNSATALDQYLAVAYFQCGVSNFLLSRYELAHKDFEEALLYLRGNQAINYEQLGLKFRLFSAEVLFNKGLSLVYLGQQEEGLRDMRDARQEKATEEHNVIDEAINDRGEGYTVFSIPVGVLYRPPENKLKNARTKDYLGKAKLVAALDAQDAYTTFTGVTRLQQGFTPTGAPIDRPVSDPRDDRTSQIDRPSPISRSATANARLERTAIETSPASASPPRPPKSADSRSLNGLPRAGPANGSGRGVLVKKEASNNVRPPAPPAKDRGGRLTEIYDDYMAAYTEEPPLPTAADGATRVAAWARKAEGAPPPPNAGRSRPPPSAYSGAGGMSSSTLRRKVTRRANYPRSVSRQGESQYDEDEDGYLSGDFDDGPFELVKIKIKLHYDGEARGMTLSPDIPFDSFVDKVTTKFGRPPTGMSFKFKDEDGGMVSLRDESDYDLAIETARENAKGRAEGKLDVYCSDT